MHELNLFVHSGNTVVDWGAGNEIPLFSLDRLSAMREVTADEYFMNGNDIEQAIERFSGIDRAARISRLPQICVQGDMLELYLKSKGWVAGKFHSGGDWTHNGRQLYINRHKDFGILGLLVNVRRCEAVLDGADRSSTDPSQLTGVNFYAPSEANDFLTEELSDIIRPVELDDLKYNTPRSIGMLFPHVTAIEMTSDIGPVSAEFRAILAKSLFTGNTPTQTTYKDVSFGHNRIHEAIHVISLQPIQTVLNVIKEIPDIKITIKEVDRHPHRY